MNPEMQALRQRLDAEAAKIGPEALRPTVEEWEAYFAARGVERTQDNLDTAVAAVAGVMSTVAQLAQHQPKGRVTASNAVDQRLKHVIDGVMLSAVALSRIEAA